MPAGTAPSTVCALLQETSHVAPPPPSAIRISTLCEQVAGLCTFSIVFVFFILCLNDDLIQNVLNVSVLLLLLLFR